MIKTNAFDAARHTADLSDQEKTLVARRSRLLGPAYQLFYDHPLHLVQGSGAYVFDENGKRYLDCYNNVVSVGHCHPKVVAAIAKQAATLNTHTRYLHGNVLDYAERLLASMPDALDRVMFTCTGSEANDLALRIAYDYTNGTGVIVTRYAYHGITIATAELSPSMGEYVAVAKDARLIAPPLHAPDQPERVAQQLLQDVQAAIADMRIHGIKPAALLVDTLFTSDGVFADPPGFLQPAVAAIREAGGVFIADEVQAGFGRTGQHMWGFQRHGIVPDIVTMGKPMGNGHPIGGVAVKADVVQRFGERAAYFNTFGGNPVSCAAGLAVLDVIETEGLMENAKATGQHLKKGLEDIATRSERVGGVRASGMYIGVDILDDQGQPYTQGARNVANQLREHGVLIGACGSHSNILKIRPPLCLSKKEADYFVASLDTVLRN